MKTASKSLAMFFVIFAVFRPVMTSGQEQAIPKTLTGTIEYCDLEARQLRIVKETGGEENLTMAKNIVVMAGDRTVSPSVLKKGMKVSVTYAEQRGEPDPRMGVPIILVAKQVRVDASVKDEPAVPPRFIDNRDGTVTDTKTKLMWQKGDKGEAVTFAEAKAYCSNLKLGGHADWRLPKKEDKDDAVVTELMMARHSKDMPADFYWSDDPTVKLAFNFLASHVLVSNIYGAKEGSRAYVRAVRSITSRTPSKKEGEAKTHERQANLELRFRLKPGKQDGFFSDNAGGEVSGNMGVRGFKGMPPIYGLRFLSDGMVTLGIGKDGTLVTDKEGIVASDETGKHWVSQKIPFDANMTFDDKESIVFLPEPKSRK
jgi:hypothetical protein